jgi:large subunit ribosomal protein L14
MIQQRTILKVSDNSGVKTVRCLKILGGFKKKYSILGDIIIISIQQLKNKLKKTSKLKKKEIYRALIIKTKINYKKKTGYENFFKKNSIVLINKQGNPIGTRILGAIPLSLKKNKLQKFISLSAGLI